MIRARDLIENIRTELRPLHEKIVGHRYVAAVEEGRVPRESLAIFTLQQHHIIASDLRSVALLLARQGDLPSRSYLLDVLHGENRALEELGRLVQALGIDPQAVRASEPIPAAFAYSAFLAWLAMYGSDAEFAAALSLNFAAWGLNCSRMGSALTARYGLKPEAVSFFQLFANASPGDAVVSEIIQSGLDRCVPEAAIARAPRMLQSYELMYWNAMAETAGMSG